MAKYLVVANLTAESPTLRNEVARVMEGDRDAAFTVLVPARPIPAVPSLAHVLTGVHDRPVELARRCGQRARSWLEAIGADITAVRIGGYDPIEAVEAELRYGDYRGVIISTLPRRISHWLRMDLPSQVARRHPDLDVRHVVAPWLLDQEQVPAAAARVDGPRL